MRLGELTAEGAAWTRRLTGPSTGRCWIVPVFGAAVTTLLGTWGCGKSITNPTRQQGVHAWPPRATPRLHVEFPKQSSAQTAISSPLGPRPTLACVCPLFSNLDHVPRLRRRAHTTFASLSCSAQRGNLRQPRPSAAPAWVTGSPSDHQPCKSGQMSDWAER